MLGFTLVASWASKEKIGRGGEGSENRWKGIFFGLNYCIINKHRGGGEDGLSRRERKLGMGIIWLFNRSAPAASFRSRRSCLIPVLLSPSFSVPLFWHFRPVLALGFMDGTVAAYNFLRHAVNAASLKYFIYLLHTINLYLRVPILAEKNEEKNKFQWWFPGKQGTSESSPSYYKQLQCMTSHETQYDGGISSIRSLEHPRHARSRCYWDAGEAPSWWSARSLSQRAAFSGWFLPRSRTETFVSIHFVVPLSSNLSWSYGPLSYSELCLDCSAERSVWFGWETVPGILGVGPSPPPLLNHP